ncbi:Organic hydroperoxide reductase OsmC/OhrA [Jatrophihabitans endophyticus]|uniref:Organic hydroperoxide reductase OsmC/OhrA n=1 Tax=Jatrophihabitans endophyticus TaxID=1206085 RepID=A0A1M5K5F6_9ACTN|nr:OsmC family protein [Jatrophihabitans endophyticus]SHG48072.1 Organic hydroperoxide reductase OsmC/OhrA [Jatrophihabitans endophyticus]
MAREHHFASRLRWSGSTAAGYRGYERTHTVTTPPAAQALQVSAAPAFLGDETHANPEQLVLAAASSCQLLSFLAEAARAGIEVVDYADDAAAVMPVTRGPMAITRIELRPVITVAAGTNHEAVERAAHRGHEQCFIANSLRSEVVVEVTVREAGTTRPAT